LDTPAYVEFGRISRKRTGKKLPPQPFHHHHQIIKESEVYSLFCTFSPYTCNQPHVSINVAIMYFSVVLTRYIWTRMVWRGNPEADELYKKNVYSWLFLTPSLSQPFFSFFLYSNTFGVTFSLLPHLRGQWSCKRKLNMVKYPFLFLTISP